MGWESPEVCVVRSTFSIEAAQRKIWGVETASSRFLTQDTAIDTRSTHPTALVFLGQNDRGSSLPE